MFPSPTTRSSIPMRLATLQRPTIFFCVNIDAQLPMRYSTFSTSPFLTHTSFFLSGNTLLMLSIPLLLFIPSMMETEWTWLRKKFELKFGLRLTGKHQPKPSGSSCSSYVQESNDFFSFLSYLTYIMKFSPSVDARSFTYSIIVYVARDSYVKLTLPFTVCNLVARLGNSLNLGSQNDQISLIDKIKLKSTCELSIYFIKFPALHKSSQQVNIHPKQWTTAVENQPNTSNIKLKIHDIPTTKTHPMISSQSTNSFDQMFQFTAQMKSITHMTLCQFQTLCQLQISNMTTMILCLLKHPIRKPSKFIQCINV